MIASLNDVPDDVFQSLGYEQQMRLLGGGQIPLNLDFYSQLRENGRLGGFSSSLLGVGAVEPGGAVKTDAPPPSTPAATTVPILGGSPVPIADVQTKNIGLPGASFKVADLNAAPSGMLGIPGYGSAAGSVNTYFPGSPTAKVAPIASVGGNGRSGPAGKLGSITQAMFNGLAGMGRAR